jgi:hypothetical protein
MTAKESLRRFRIIADLHEAGVALMRQNIRRRDPGLSAREVEHRLARWLARVDQPLPADSDLVRRPRRSRRAKP